MKTCRTDEYIVVGKAMFSEGANICSYKNLFLYLHSRSNFFFILVADLLAKLCLKKENLVFIW